MLKIDSLLKTCFNDVTYHFLGGSLRLAFQHSPTLLSICLHMCTLMSILHLLSCSIWKHGKSLWIWRFYAGFGMVFPGFFPHLARRAPRPKWTRQSSSINSGGWDHWAGFFWQDAIGNSHTMYGILAFFYLDLVDFYGEIFLGHIPYIPYMHALRFSLWSLDCLAINSLTASTKTFRKHISTQRSSMKWKKWCPTFATFKLVAFLWAFRFKKDENPSCCASNVEGSH